MKKIMFVIAFLMVCILAASAKDSYYSFYFRDTNGNAYCDGMSLRLYSPAAGYPKILVGGTHFYYDCANTTYVGGFKHALSSLYQYNGTGAVLDVACPHRGLWGTANSTNHIVNTTSHTWVFYAGSDGAGNYVVNYGTWINGANPQVKGPGQRSSDKP